MPSMAGSRGLVPSILGVDRLACRQLNNTGPNARCYDGAEDTATWASRTMNVTFDTNCIIALEENRPDAMHLRRIAQAAAKQQLELRIVAISASERQPDGRYSENFSVFRAKVVNIGLGDVQILSAPAIVGMAYVGHSTVVSDQFCGRGRANSQYSLPHHPVRVRGLLRASRP